MNTKILKTNKMFARLTITLLIVALSFSLCVDSSFAFSPDLAVDPHTPEEIVEYAQTHPMGELYSYENGIMVEYWNRNIGYAKRPVLEAPYSPGELNDDETVYALNTIKLTRYIAGLSDNVYLSDEYNRLAQASSLINYVNNYLTHTPATPAGMSESLASLGKEGASHSNIAWTSWPNNSLKWSIINGWMHDGDYSNIAALGHRRWILNPSMGATGFGLVTGNNGTYSSMYSLDMSNPDSEKYMVAWPAQNMPTSFFPSDCPWSISVGTPIDPNTINVSLVRINDGKTWTFSSSSSDGDFYVNNGYYGQPGCIIFRPNDVTEYKPGDSFTVKITGPGGSISYQVDFFDLERFYSPSAPKITNISTNTEGKPSIEWDAVENADNYDLFRKVYGGSWKILKSDLTKNSFDDVSAGKGLQYYYMVVAKRTVNNTVYYSEPSAYKKITTLLTRPSIYYCKSTSKHTNTIKWKKISGATTYKVYRRVSGKKTWSTVKITSSCYFKDTKAKSNTAYEYRVKAFRRYYNFTSCSKYSLYKKVRTK